MSLKTLDNVSNKNESYVRSDKRHVCGVMSSGLPSIVTHGSPILTFKNLQQNSLYINSSVEQFNVPQACEDKRTTDEPQNN